jgi:DNA-binding CsgD family transcriptional regulator
LADELGARSTLSSSLGIQGLVEVLLGRDGWQRTFQAGIAVEPAAEPAPIVARASFSLAAALSWVDELDEARDLLHLLLERAVERGEESGLPWILAQLAFVEFYAGQWREATERADEAMELALQTSQKPQQLFAQGVRALVRSAQGEVDGARSDAQAVLGPAQDQGVMIATILAVSALGLLELGLRQFDAAYRLFAPLDERLEQGGVREPGSARFITDEIEALVGLGRLDEAEALLERVEGRAKTVARASVGAACMRCRGLLTARRGDLDGALAALDQAVREHNRVPMPFDRARTLLALGSTQRRARMKRRARETLYEARGMFEALGAQLWGELARAEIARIGGRGPATDELTPSERRVAALVAEGRSNKDVAVALVVTVKTVESHLSRIYAKLGLHSRAELAHRFATEKIGEPSSKQ